MFGSAGDFGVNCPLFCVVECLAAAVRWVLGALHVTFPRCRLHTMSEGNSEAAEAAMTCVK